MPIDPRAGPDWRVSVPSVLLYALVLVVLRFGVGASWLVAVLAAFVASTLCRMWLLKRVARSG